MKKSLILTIILAAVFAVSPYFSLAQSPSSSAAVSVDDVLSEIRQSQNVSQNSDIKCDKMTNDQFEKLGDAVEDVMHPNEAQQDLMEQMMGGEGSNSLKAMHILMGQRYLGCGGYGGMRDRFFGPGYNYGMPMMNWDDGYGYGMMGNYGTWGWLGWIFMVLFWILVVVALISFVRWLATRDREEHRGRSALDILKERYAKGEINKEEFEAKKKDLV